MRKARSAFNRDTKSFTMDNSQIAEIFETIANLLEVKGENVFTVRAYQRASRTIERYPEDIQRMVAEGKNLREISGIGRAISEKINEMLSTGGLKYLETLKSEFPSGLLEIMKISGIGPKTARILWKEAGVTNITELETAIRQDRLKDLPRVGKKLGNNILREIEFLQNKDNKFPISIANREAKLLVEALATKCESIEDLIIAGSLRRFEETIGNIDLICVTEKPEAAINSLIQLQNSISVLEREESKVTVMLASGIKVDCRVVSRSRLGAMLQYFTGNQQHLISLKNYAHRKNFSLNEYGITHMETGEIEFFGDEKSFYSRLGLQYIPPELRIGLSEIVKARGGQIPVLVQEGDIRGDLHVHSDWSDGKDTIEDMVQAAKDRGLDYIAITDHSVGRGIANGLDVERLNQHKCRLRKASKAIGGIEVLSGTEMDIRGDGSLDYPDHVLKDIDWVIGSIHSGMSQSSSIMTERIIKAMRNPYISVIGHLSTRLIGERKSIDADFDAIFRAAADTGTALEINSSPERLDLKDIHVLQARQMGVSMVITTDAHSIESLDNLKFGIAVAKRGWCEPENIVNTLNYKEFEKYLNMEKAQRKKVLAKNG